MHEQSGDVATEMEWRDDYENMDVESWHGCEAKDAPENWLENSALIEVEKNNDGDWVEV